VARSAAGGTLWPSPKSVLQVAQARTLVVDPEGSLLEGSLRLSGVATDEELGEDGALRLAAPLARRIENPAAFCLLKEIKIRNIPLAQLDAFFPAPGGGYGIVSDSEVRLCDEATAVQEDIPYAKFHAFLRQEMNRPGASAQLLLKNGTAVAAFTFVDTVRDSSVDAVRDIRRAGRTLVLLSAARKESVAALAQETHVEHFHAEALPSTAAELMSRLSAEGMAPLWLDNGLAPLPEGKFSWLGGPQAGPGAAGITARTDLRSQWQALRLALSWRLFTRRLFLTALVLQLALTGLCVARPLLGALAAALLFAWGLRGPAKAIVSRPLPY
jgi:Cu+-exporting ATPase